MKKKLKLIEGGDNVTCMDLEEQQRDLDPRLDLDLDSVKFPFLANGL